MALIFHRPQNRLVPYSRNESLTAIFALNKTVYIFSAIYLKLLYRAFIYFLISIKWWNIFIFYYKLGQYISYMQLIEILSDANDSLGDFVLAELRNMENYKFKL